MVRDSVVIKQLPTSWRPPAKQHTNCPPGQTISAQCTGPPNVEGVPGLSRLSIFIYKIIQIYTKPHCRPMFIIFHNVSYCCLDVPCPTSLASIEAVPLPDTSTHPFMMTCSFRLVSRATAPQVLRCSFLRSMAQGITGQAKTAVSQCRPLFLGQPAVVKTMLVT